MEAFLISISTAHPLWIYGSIFVLSVIEGPILSMILGVLLKLEYFPFWPVYITLMLGDLIGDVVWYLIGRTWGYGFISKYGKYFSITESAVEKATHFFHAYKNRILFISKVSNGFGFALVTLMTAGMLRVPFYKYMGVNFIGQFIWSGLLLGVGYFFGDLYQKVDTALGYIGVTALAVVVILAFLGWRNYVKTQMKAQVKHIP